MSTKMNELEYLQGNWIAELPYNHLSVLSGVKNISISSNSEPVNEHIFNYKIQDELNYSFSESINGLKYVNYFAEDQNLIMSYDSYGSMKIWNAFYSNENITFKLDQELRI